VGTLLNLSNVSNIIKVHITDSRVSFMISMPNSIALSVKKIAFILSAYKGHDHFLLDAVDKIMK